MGFIYGIIDFNGKNVKDKEIKALEDAVKWENFKVNTEQYGAVALGYCYHPNRTPKSGICQDEDLIVLADARIYNTEELKKSFDFNLPEEAVAKAFRKWGTACADHINGDFAAVVYDKKQKQVHLFRDHIGVRPLVYWFSENRLIFASHEFGVMKSGLIAKAIDEERVIQDFFRFKASYEKTIFQDILNVTPGYCVSFSLGKKKITKYWKPEKIKINKSLTYEEAVSKLKQLMVSATVKRMDDVKIGAHVSGGIDSTGVASMVADHIADKTQMIGYSWSPEEFDGEIDGPNEKDFIGAFQEDKNVEIQYMKLHKNERLEDALDPKFSVMHIEHPVMKKAGKDDVELMFTGWGGDEFVSLSGRGVVNHLVFNLKLRAILKYTRKVGVRNFVKALRRELLPLFIPFYLLPVYKAQYFDFSKLRSLKTSTILKHWKPIVFHDRRSIFGYGNRTRFMLNLLENYHIPKRMDSWAFNGDRYGIEYRYPLLDKDVLEFWFSIPVELAYKNFHSRILYRDAMEGIMVDKVRMRPDKADTLLISSTRKAASVNKEHTKQMFDALSEEEQLPWFRLKYIEKGLLHQPKEDDSIKARRKLGKVTFYLAYVRIVKEYLS